MTKFSRSSTGKYVVQGKSYEALIGTRAQVWHGTAYKTTGGLTHAHLMQNKAGRIVSKAKHMTAKKEKRLVKAGYGTKKGKFGYVKIGTKSRRNKRGGFGLSPAASVPASTPVPVAVGAASPAAVRVQPGTGLTGTTTAVAKGGRRHKRGGMYALSPSAYDGKGVGTSGVNLQFVAGNASS